LKRDNVAYTELRRDRGRNGVDAVTKPRRKERTIGSFVAESVACEGGVSHVVGTVSLGFGGEFFQQLQDPPSCRVVPRWGRTISPWKHTVRLQLSRLSVQESF